MCRRNACLLPAQTGLVRLVVFVLSASMVNVHAQRPGTAKARVEREKIVNSA